jgi:hypothetical protein
MWLAAPNIKTDVEAAVFEYTISLENINFDRALTTTDGIIQGIIKKKIQKKMLPSLLCNLELN